MLLPGCSAEVAAGRAEDLVAAVRAAPVPCPTAGGGPPAYSVSRTALNALTRMLAPELRADGVLVDSVCRGWVATDVGGAGGRPVADGAASVLWAVDLPDDGPTGGFFRDGRALPW